MGEHKIVAWKPSRTSYSGFFACPSMMAPLKKESRPRGSRKPLWQAKPNEDVIAAERNRIRLESLHAR